MYQGHAPFRVFLSFLGISGVGEKKVFPAGDFEDLSPEGCGQEVPDRCCHKN
jgi:hypothetical protein